MRDLKKRSLAKTISRRITATFITIVISFLFLRETVTSIALGITINPIKSTVYSPHERIWDRAKWGRISE